MAMPTTDDGMLKVVVVDMDGTFLNSSPVAPISLRNRQLVSTLLDRGVTFAIATGRPAKALQPFIDDLSLDSVHTIVFNGACLQRARAGKPAELIWQQTLPAKLAARILALVRGPSLGLALSYSTRDCAVALVDSDAQRAQLATYERLEGVSQDVVVDSIDSLQAAAGDAAPLKIVGFSADPEADAATARDALQGEAVHVIAAEMHIEFLCDAVNKATALHKLCDVLGVGMSSVVAFGDGNNDAEMLAAVGLGCAMANARPAAKAAAAETLEWTNDEDGVSRRVEALLADRRLVGSAPPRAGGA